MRMNLIVQIVAAVVVVVFAAGILATDGEVQAGWLRFYTIAVIMAILVLVAWDRFLWHTRIPQRFKAVPRDLRGTWSGTLESFWEDDETGEPPLPKQVYLVVRQTAFEVSVVLLTDESRSVSTLVKVCDDGTSATLDYMYLNHPDSRFEDRSRMHHGSASIELIGRPVTRLKGRYWTSRDSKGELSFERRDVARADGFLEAGALFPASSTGEPEVDAGPTRPQLHASDDGEGAES